jgi:uncharacterized protein (TIGR03437 family)
MPYRSVTGSPVSKKKSFNSPLPTWRPVLGWGCLILAASSFIFGESLRPTEDSIPVAFEPNLGQAPKGVQYLARIGSATLFFTADRVLINQAGGSEKISFGFRGGNMHAPRGESATGGKSNYFFSTDQRKWLTGIPHFERLVYSQLYPGIDVVFYSKSGIFEYDLVVAPGADPHTFEIFFDTPTPLVLNNTGDIELRTTFGSLFNAKPVARQMGERGATTIPCRYYRTTQNAFRLEVERYDEKLPLVIDPVVVFSTFLGGSGQNLPYSIATDSSGNVIVAGNTSNSLPGVYDFPITTNASYTGSFIAKINSAGTKLVFSTYFGGSAQSVAADSSGNIFVGGAVSSGNGTPSFPVTPGAYQTAVAGGSDAFIMKLSPDGGSVLYATLFGGNGGEQARCIAVAPDGTVYISGYTNSTNLPLTSGAFQTTYGGGGDAFLAKLSADGHSLLYSSYIGGGGQDQVFSMTLGSDGSAFITGPASNGFPSTSGAFANSAGNNQFFIARINPTGTSTSSLIYSAVVTGGSSSGIAADSSGNAYVVGTANLGFPVTTGSYFSTFMTNYGRRLLSLDSQPSGFVVKLSSDGSHLLYSMLIGANDTVYNLADAATGVSVDGSGNAYVVGTTTEWTFPSSANALFSFPSELVGGFSPSGAFLSRTNGFLIELDTTGANLLYSTFLGPSVSGASGQPISSGVGKISIVGVADSAFFPVTAGAVQATYKGTPTPGIGNLFVLSLDLNSDLVPWISGVASAATLTGDSVSPGEIVTIKGHGIGPNASITATPTANVFPTIVSGVSVLVNGVAAPILYAGPGQINAILPYAISGQSTVNIEVDNAGQRSNVWNAPIVAANPTVFMVGDPHSRNIIVQNADGTLMSAQHPCKVGACSFTVYLTGAGLTSPQDLDGQVSGIAPSKPALPVEVSLVGLPATITYVGGAPLEVSGLIQLNIQTNGCGSQGTVTCTSSAILQITVGGHASSSYLFEYFASNQ